MSRDLKYFPLFIAFLCLLSWKELRSRRRHVKEGGLEEVELHKAAHNGAHLFSTELNAYTKNLRKEMQDLFE